MKTQEPRMAMSETERQAAYRVRLEAAGKMVIRVVVSRDFAARLRRMARDDVTRGGPVLEKALAALEAAESGASGMPST
jgi:hypothetical protein